MKRVAIVQARMSSTRFPGKVLELIDQVPMIVFMLRRVDRARCIDHVLVATSDHHSDDVLESTVRRHGYDCFRGSLPDVLDRFASAARFHSADVVVRLTGDCPLIDSDIVDRCVDAVVDSGYDYVSNVDPPSFPDGLDVEAFTIDALRSAASQARASSDREHVTPFIRRNKAQFRQMNISSIQDFSRLRWTVDHPDDLDFVRALVGAAKAFGGGVADRFDFLRAMDSTVLVASNSRHLRNEGYREDADACETGQHTGKR